MTCALSSLSFLFLPYRFLARVEMLVLRETGKEYLS
jgi:hypothetical protein